MLDSFGCGGLCENGVDLLINGRSHGTSVDVERLDVFYFDFVVLIYFMRVVQTFISRYLSLPLGPWQKMFSYPSLVLAELSTLVWGDVR